MAGHRRDDDAFSIPFCFFSPQLDRKRERLEFEILFYVFFLQKLKRKNGRMGLRTHTLSG